jgi:hypothetical protein
MHTKIKSLKVTGFTWQSPIKKGFNGRNVFYVEGTYTLADGTKRPMKVTAERKKHVPRAIEQEQKSVEAGSVTAEYWQDGDIERTGYWMYSTRFTIGASGLQPYAGHKDSGIPAETIGDKPSRVGGTTTLLDAVAESNATHGA